MGNSNINWMSKVSESWFHPEYTPNMYELSKFDPTLGLPDRKERGINRFESFAIFN
jgi:hypothetical protein